jgi:hypothetical protein
MEGSNTSFRHGAVIYSTGTGKFDYDPIEVYVTAVPDADLYLAQIAALQFIEEPALTVVILGGAGDHREIVGGFIVGVHETATAELLDRETAIAGLQYYPALGVVVLGFTRHQPKIFRRDLMSVHKAPIALLAHRVDGST